MMTMDELRDYLSTEIADERNKYLMGCDNHYSYLLMLCNDIGLTTSFPELFPGL